MTAGARAITTDTRDYEWESGLVCQECARVFSEHDWPDGDDHVPWREQTDNEASADEATWD